MPSPPRRHSAREERSVELVPDLGEISALTIVAGLEDQRSAVGVVPAHLRSRQYEWTNGLLMSGNRQRF